LNFVNALLSFGAWGLLSLSIFHGEQPLGSQGLLIIEASRLHSNSTHSVGFLWTSDQPIAENHIWQITTFTTDRHTCTLAGFEPAIPASQRPQTHALDRAVTGIRIIQFKIINCILLILSWKALFCSAIFSTWVAQNGRHGHMLKAVDKVPTTSWP
jgi:hypothetical protein